MNITAFLLGDEYLETPLFYLDYVPEKDTHIDYIEHVGGSAVGYIVTSVKSEVRSYGDKCKTHITVYVEKISKSSGR